MEDGLGVVELDSDSEDSDEDDISEAEVLQKILDDEELSPISRSVRIDKICMNLTSAALAVATEEAVIVCDLFIFLTLLILNPITQLFPYSQTFADVDEEELEGVIAEECAQVQRVSEIYKTLPAVRLQDEPSRPLGHGTVRYGDLDFEALIEMRRKHQTKQAATGVRTTKSKPTSGTLRGRIIREFHQALKEAQDEQAVGTGIERKARWRQPAPGGRDGIIDGAHAPDLAAGNSANAAATAAIVAKQACIHVFFLPLILL